MRSVRRQRDPGYVGVTFVSAGDPNKGVRLLLEHATLLAESLELAQRHGYPVEEPLDQAPAVHFPLVADSRAASVGEPPPPILDRVPVPPPGPREKQLRRIREIDHGMDIPTI